MTARPRLLLVLLLTALPVVPAQARLGETLAEIRARYDAPTAQSRKDNATWLFEGEDGALLYTVTFDARGRSIAEGLKPVKQAKFTRNTALDFIESQLAPYQGSKTVQIIPEGAKYRFAGRDFTCARDEYVVVDEPQGLLLIWSQVVNPAVLVVAPEMLRRGG